MTPILNGQRPARRFSSLLLCSALKGIIVALGPLLAVTTAQAQWRTETYTLKGGWNAIYLHGDASYDTIDNLLPNSGTTANVTEIWSWNPNPDAVQFTDSQMVPSSGTTEWSVWKRGLAAETTLSTMAGQHAYLVKCLGTSSSSYSVTIKQAPQLPSNSWVRNGANLLGFPTYQNSSIFPTFASYFATFPAAIASSSRVFKYAGGDLGATNPIQMFSTTSERVDRNQAYWFSAKVAGEYYAPLEFSLTSSDGLNFGRAGSDIKLRIRNRTSAVVTVTLTPTASEAEPSNQTTVAGEVALTSRTYNAATAAWTETALGASSTQVIAPQSTVELSFGIDRTAMTGAVNSFYASLLRITESSSLMDVYLPVTAYKASLAGLWVGDISLNSVSNKVSNPARAKATLTNGVVTGLSVEGSGGFGYTSAPTVSITAPSANGNTQATATAAVSGGKVTSVAANIVGYGYSIAPSVSISAPPESVQSIGSSSMATGSNAHQIGAISLVNGGYGYATAPAVTIAAPPASITATGVAALSGATVGSISVGEGGSYYTTAPTVTVAAPTVPVTAVAPTPTLSSGAIYAAGYGLIGKYYQNRTLGINPIDPLLASTPTSTFTQTAAINYSIMPAGTFPSQTSTGTFTVTWEGWFDVTKEGTGTYTFGTGSDDGSMIFMDLNGDGDYADTGEAIVTNDGEHGQINRIGEVSLTQNYVKMAISYFENDYGEVMIARFKKGSYADFGLLDTLQCSSGHFLTSLPVTTAGSGYTMPPLVIPGPPATATAPLATATLSGSSVGSISHPSVVAPQYGLNGKYYRNRTLSLNPVAPLLAVTPTSTFTHTAAINYSSMPVGTFPSQTSRDNFTLLWEGFFDVTKEGTGIYTFGAGSDDGSMIFIDLNGDGDYADAGETIVSNDGAHGAAYVIGSVNLTQSYVKIAIAYFEGGNDELMRVRFKKGSYTAFNALDILQGDSGHFLTSLPGGRYNDSFPTISISAPPTAINATATVAGTTTAWTITKGTAGSGYATVPTVTITGGTNTVIGTATATLGLTTNSFTLTSGNVIYSVGPTVTISGGGSPTTTATATAVLTSGVVTGIAIVNMGVGYTTAPTLTFSGGTVTSGVVYPTAVGNAAQFGVSTITKGSNGTYSSAPTGATITAAPITVQATATPVFQYGSVSGYTITNAGSGYLTAPSVSFVGGNFFTVAQAVGRATLSNGGVGAINYDTYGGGTGSNYVISPAVTIAAPVTGGAQSPLASAAASTGSEILNDGTLVEANHFGPTATVASLTLGNGLTFGALGSSQTRFTVTGNPTLSYSTSTATASSVTDTAYKALMQNQVNSVTAGAAGALTIPGLTIGRIYRIQLISDGLPATLSVEGGSAVNYYFTGDNVSAAAWTAADTIGNITVNVNSGSTLNLKGYALHDITTLATRTTATATAAISNGAVTGYSLTNVGSGYTSAPAVTMSGGVFVTPVQATATSSVSNGVVTGFTVTNPGAGYVTVTTAGSSYVTTPAVTVDAPAPAVTAAATATLSGSTVTGYTITTPGSGYFDPPTVSLSIPDVGNQPATATATVSNGSVTGFTVTSGGVGYTVTPKVTISAPPAQTGTGTAGTFPLRTLLHVADDGTANLLSKVYLGQLALAPHAYGLTINESLLQTTTLSSAHRLSAGHLPTGRVITGSGSVALGGSLVCTISLPYNDPTNPFVHQFHPDHDNLDAQFLSLAEGVESYTVERVATFSFTTTPPSGSSVTTGWGSRVIGGTYREVISGLHSSSIQLDGTFEIRRASEIGTLSQ